MEGVGGELEHDRPIDLRTLLGGEDDGPIYEPISLDEGVSQVIADPTVVAGKDFKERIRRDVSDTYDKAMRGAN